MNRPPGRAGSRSEGPSPARRERPLVAPGRQAAPEPAAAPNAEPAAPAEPTAYRSESYLRTLFVLLIAATFFEGYDGAILALVLPDIQDTFNAAESELGVSRGFIELGLFFAFFLARLGDRIGRRTLLLWSVFGYTIFTTLTAVSWDLWSFTVFQSAARVFLGAEYAVAITMIVEEFPADRRSGALGRLLLMAAGGALVVAVFLLVGIDQGPLEWRTLYLIGVFPLLVLGWLRRRVRETARFEAHRDAVEAGAEVHHVSFFEVWHPEHRRNLLLVGMLHLLRSLPLFGSTAWFFFFAQREAGIDRVFLFLTFIGAYGIGIGGYAFCGFLMERLGRRPTAIVYGTASFVFPILLFQTRSALVAPLLASSVFFGLGIAPLYGAMSTELFPTRIRNQAAAWARNVFEIAGFILGPLLVGVLGDHYTGAFGSIGDTVSLLFLLGIPGLYLLWRYLPETRGRELEEIEAEVSGLVVEPALSGSSPPLSEAQSAGRRRAWIGLSAAVAVTVLVVVTVIRLGDVVRRPEGAAERFLKAVSDDETDRVDTYGTPELQARLTAFARDDADKEWFTGVEVGHRTEEIGGVARVPFRVERQDEGESELFGFLSVVEQPGDDPREWRVVDVVEDLAVEPLVPSGGGPEPASAAGSTWLGGIVAAVALAAAAEVLLRAVGSRPWRAAMVAGHAGQEPRPSG